MVDVLTDVYIARALYYSKLSEFNTTEKRDALMQSVFDKSLYDPSNERAIVQYLSSSFYDDAIDKITQTIKLTNLEKHQLEQLRIIKCD